jgi:hypothetical protein
VAADDRAGRHRRGPGRRRPGNPDGVPWWVQGGPAAAQELGGLVGVDLHEPLELLGIQFPDSQPVALVDRPATLIIQVLAGEVVGIGVLAHVLLPSAS